MPTAHPFNISQIRKSQCEGSGPHGPAIAKGTTAVELVPSRLVHITELRRGQLLQHLDHARTITTTWGRTVLLSEPAGLRHQGLMRAKVFYRLFEFYLRLCVLKLGRE